VSWNVGVDAHRTGIRTCAGARCRVSERVSGFTQVSNTKFQVRVVWIHAFFSELDSPYIKYELEVRVIRIVWHVFVKYNTTDHNRCYSCAHLLRADDRIRAVVALLGLAVCPAPAALWSHEKQNMRPWPGSRAEPNRAAGLVLFCFELTQIMTRHCNYVLTKQMHGSCFKRGY
jgi:hypothetical protein